MFKKIIYLLALATIWSCNSTEEVSESDASGMKMVFSRNTKTKQKDGAFTRFYASGKKFEEANYLLDSLNGKRTVFYESGVIQTIENYRKGRYDGDYKAYFEDGKLEQEGKYLNNEMTGEWKTYYANGQLKESVMFAHNEENGPFKEYYPDGKLKAEGTYQHGEVPVGELKEYHKTGALMRIAQCIDGICRTQWAADTTKFQTSR